jgi:hypothetical protein
LTTSGQIKSPHALWHELLGHPVSTMLAPIVKGSHGLPTNLRNILASTLCIAFSCGKLVAQPSLSKLPTNIPSFLSIIHADVRGPINPPSGPFRYFMPMIDAFLKWSTISLLTMHNMVFPRLLAQILCLRAQFPKHPIKVIQVENAGEFTSPTFDNYCTTVGIDCQYSIPHVHFQNGLAEAIIKRFQLIARPLIMQSQLPTTA